MKFNLLFRSTDLSLVSSPFPRGQAQSGILARKYKDRVPYIVVNWGARLQLKHNRHYLKHLVGQYAGDMARLYNGHPATDFMTIKSFKYAFINIIIPIYLSELKKNIQL